MSETEREPIIRIWDAAMTGQQLRVSLDDGSSIQEDSGSVVLVPEGWYSLGILKPGSQVCIALEHEQFCCIDSVRRGERGARVTVVEVTPV